MTGAPRRSVRQLWLPFPIRIHYSWVLTVSVISALFAVLYFRGVPGISAAGAAALGVVTSVLLLASVLVHELAHAAAAARSGLKVSGITLRVFGGATELEGHPRDAAAELRIALAGPFATLVLFVSFLAAGRIFAAPAPVLAVTNNLALINGLLLAFNLIPAVPLDGGRILRAVLWAVWDRPLAATRAVAATRRRFRTPDGRLRHPGALRRERRGRRCDPYRARRLVRPDRTQPAADLTRGDPSGLARPGARRDHPPPTCWTTGSSRSRGMLPRPSCWRSKRRIPRSRSSTRRTLVGAVRLEDLRRRSSDELERLTAGDLMRTDILATTLAPGDAAIRAVNLLTGGRRSLAVLDAGRFVGVVTMETLRSRLSLRSDV